MSRMIAVGNWMLAKMAHGPYTDAVAGDLMEGVRAGQSAGWYWGQVMAAIGAAWMAELKARRGALLFSVLWTGLFLIVWYGPLHDMQRKTMSRVMMNSLALPWPFSMMFGLLYEELLEISFVWVGSLLYLAISRRWRPDASAMRVLGGWMVSLCTCVLGRFVLRLIMFSMSGHQTLRANLDFAWIELMLALSLYCAIVMATPARRVAVAG